MINENIIIAIVSATPPTLVALLAWLTGKENARAIKDIHISINSRMTELLAATKGQATAEGKEIGRNEK
jgi:hypothetical protein